MYDCLIEILVSSYIWSCYLNMLLVCGNFTSYPVGDITIYMCMTEIVSVCIIKYAMLVIEMIVITMITVTCMLPGNDDIHGCLLHNATHPLSQYVTYDHILVKYTAGAHKEPSKKYKSILRTPKSKSYEQCPTKHYYNDKAPHFLKA